MNPNSGGYAVRAGHLPMVAYMRPGSDELATAVVRRVSDGTFEWRLISRMDP